MNEFERTQQLVARIKKDLMTPVHKIELRVEEIEAGRKFEFGFPWLDRRVCLNKDLLRESANSRYSGIH